MPPNPLRLYVPALARLYETTWQLTEVVLRVVSGLLLLPHGAQKLFGMFDGQGLTATAQLFDKMGYWPGAFWAPFVGCLQVFGGIILAIGLFTRPIACLLFILFLFSIYFRFPRGIFAWEGGVEYAILWAAALLFFAIRGGNKWSVDATMKKEF